MKVSFSTAQAIFNDLYGGKSMTVSTLREHMKQNPYLFDHADRLLSMIKVTPAKKTRDTMYKRTSVTEMKAHKRQILAHLKKNKGAFMCSIVQAAPKNLSKTAIYNRVYNLKSGGYIKRTAAGKYILTSKQFTK